MQSVISLFSSHACPQGIDNDIKFGVDLDLFMLKYGSLLFWNKELVIITSTETRQKSERADLERPSFLVPFIYFIGNLRASDPLVHMLLKVVGAFFVRILPHSSYVAWSNKESAFFP